DKGRSEGEKSVVLVENGVYKGFGFVDREAQLSTPEQLKDHIKRYEDNRDVQQMIRSYLNQKKVEKILEL
ncbi:MAG TPA: hypothetical protein DCX54_01560, partial [Flavobacteriales bacterium]|nr:hypothetical protein [Flavobacteriales bacterium]